jgi:hypothetical protein
MKTFVKFEDEKGMPVLIDPLCVTCVTHYDYLRSPEDNRSYPFSAVYESRFRAHVVKGDPEQVAKKLVETAEQASPCRIRSRPVVNTPKPDMQETPEQRRERDAFP